MQLSASDGFYKNTGLFAGFGKEKVKDIYGRVGMGVLGGGVTRLGIEAYGQAGSYLAEDFKTLYVAVMAGPKAGLQYESIGVYVSRFWGFSPTFVLLDEDYESSMKTYFSSSWDFQLAFTVNKITAELHYVIDKRMPQQNKTAGIGVAYSFF